MDSLIIANPKHRINCAVGRASWYHYYPGFSARFAHSILKSSGIPRHAIILDPWNGSGTTTSAASSLGFQAVGYDLNPVMVIAAKARLLHKTERSSLWPLACEITAKAERINSPVTKDEPLNNWMRPESAGFLRKLEITIQRLLVDEGMYKSFASRDSFDGLSCLAAFYYIALFQTARTLIKRFYSTNPTWTKIPASKAKRIRPDWECITGVFTERVNAMISHFENDPFDDSDANVQIHKGTSEALPIPDGSVDFVLTSPPYCTRIDYAVATRIELALLGYKEATTFNVLRRNLIGASTVPATKPETSHSWGTTCLHFLDRLKGHASKASNSYYYLNHLQYFDAIQRSLNEISRTMKQSASCVLVVQDSYYKEIHNDLPKMIIQMSKETGLLLKRRKDFLLQRTMAGIHPGAKQYRDIFHANESVLCFAKAQ